MGIIDFLFPQKCFGCQKIGSWLCPDCFAQIKPIKNQSCPVCGKPSFLGITHSHHQRKILDGVLILFSYRMPLKAMMSVYKYQLVRQLTKIWFDLIKIGFESNKELVNYWRKEKFILISVPLFSTRLNWRGFDQTACLADKISNYFQIRFNNKILRRTRWTKSQVGLSPNLRKRNLKKAFTVVSKSACKNQNFLIFDDVFTTGTTIKTIASLLKQNGADKVWGLAILG